MKTQAALREIYQKKDWLAAPKPATEEEAFLVNLKAIIIENIGTKNFGVSELASAIGMSVSTLYRKVRALTGYTVNEF